MRLLPLASVAGFLVLVGGALSGFDEAPPSAAPPAIVVPTVSSSPVSQEAPCAGPGPHRDFDYWLGTWDVYDGDGRRIGSNTIESVSAGCAVLESWTPVQGLPGTSLNFHDRDSEQWEQVWRGGGGGTLRLVGGLDSDGVMTLRGATPRSTPQGEVLDRIRWVPQEDGSVHQIWDLSSDGGESWTTSFLGIYRRVG